MKIKKLFTALLICVMAISIATAFAACGGGSDDPDKDKGQANTKSYQLNGSLKDDLGPLGKGFEVMLNLNVDGTSVLARYNPYNYNAEDAATNRDFEAEFMTGTWKAAQKEGIDCLQIKLAAKAQDGSKANDITVYSYEAAGVYTVEITVPIVVGQSFTRSISLTGGETKKYADANAFIQGTKMTFVAPEYITTFVATANSKTIGTLYVLADGEVSAYYGYNEIAKGTYVKDATSMTVNLKGTDYPVTIEGNKGSFKYVHNIYGDYNADLNFVCDDMSKVPEAGAPEFTQVAYTGTFKGTQYTITLTSATECEYKTGGYGGQVPAFECTYTLDNKNVIKLTIKNEPTNAGMVQIWNGMKSIVWTLNEADKTMTGVENYTSTTTVTVKNPMNQSDMDAHLVIGIIDGTTCKYYVSEFGGMLGSFECTYTLDGNVITLTLKGDEPTEGMNAGFWAVMKTTLSWTLDSAAHTMTVQAD